MSEPVLNAGWYQYGVAFCVPHEMMLPPPIPSPPLPGITEGPAFMGMPAPGASTAPTVLVDGNPGIQHKHNVDLAVLHIPAIMNSLAYVNFLWPKHKVMVPVKSVILGGKPVGTYFFGALGATVCADPISLPMGVLVNKKCTVVTKATVADFLAWIGNMALDAVTDYVFKKLFLKMDFLSEILAKSRKALAEALAAKVGSRALAEFLAYSIVKSYGEVPLKIYLVKPIVKKIAAAAEDVGTQVGKTIDSHAEDIGRQHNPFGDVTP